MSFLSECYLQQRIRPWAYCARAVRKFVSGEGKRLSRPAVATGSLRAVPSPTPLPLRNGSVNPKERKEPSRISGKKKGPVESRIRPFRLAPSDKKGFR